MTCPSLHIDASECLAGLQGKKTIAVIGDLMLDHYISGPVLRISPEAPVPVVKIDSERYIAGGAGNVVANLRGLQAGTAVFGRVGDDLQGKILQNLLSPADAQGMVHLNLTFQGRTIEKIRVLGNGRQQIVRMDREEILSLPEKEEIRIIENLNHLAEKPALVILSDYGKGIISSSLCRKVLKFCAERDIPLFVDPKTADWERYRGADLVTPNVAELSAAAGCAVANEDDVVLRWGQEVRRRFGLKHLLVTRSEKGATFISDSLCFHEPTTESDVYDVSGAGDTMIATVAACRASGMDWRSCVYCANLASQVVIGKVGTCPITLEDLRHALGRAQCLSRAVVTRQSKIVAEDEAYRLCRFWQERGERVVFTNGCFDIFHAGHADSLIQARALGDRLIVGVNSDESVRRLKGSSRPVNPLDARMAVLSALESVDLVVSFSEDTPERLLSLLRPSVIAKGGDYRPDQVAGRQFAGEVVILPLKSGFSSTGILAKLGGGE